MEVWRSGGVELGGMLRARRRGGKQMNGDLDLSRPSAGVGTCRRRGMELWRRTEGTLRA